MSAHEAPAFRARDDIRVQPTGAGAVVVDLVTGRCFELNATGYLIWSLVTEGLSPEAIATRISDSYGVPRDQAMTDAAALVAMLLDEQLLSPRTSDAGL